MTYPVGVETITVTSSGFLDMFGESCTLEVKVRPYIGEGAARLVWAATSEALNMRPRTFIGRGEQVEFTVPYTDQAGWIDGSGEPFQGWAYEAESTVYASDSTTVRARWRQMFQPVVADGPVMDLDQIPDGVPGSVSLPVYVAGPPGPIGLTGPQGLPGPQGEQGEPGPALPADQIATLSTQFAKTEIGEAASASTQRLLAKLTRGQQSASIVIIGDSTSGSSPATVSVRWPWLIADALGDKFPAYTVNYYAWDPNLLSSTGIDNYAAPVTVQTGTGTDNAGGPFVLSVYVFAVGNSSTDYQIGHMDRGVGAIQPDLIFISHGHNEQHTMLPFITPTQYKGQMLALTESARAAAPRASVIIIGQNPDPNSHDQAVKADEYETVAELKGFGFLDIHQAFIDYGDWVNDLMQSPTDKHPNAAGQALMAAEVMKAFTYRRNQPPRVPLPSSLLEPAEPLNFNPDFSVWVDGSSPIGYRLSGAAVNKNYTNVDNDEVGYSCRITATGAAPSFIEFRVPAAKWRNQPVNVAVRLRLPSGSPTTAGSVQIGSQINSNGDPTSLVTWRNARSNSIITGKFVWVVLEHNVVSTASWIVVRIYADTANNAAADISVQRVVLVPGVLPHGRASVRLTALPTLTYANPAAIPGLSFAWEADDYGGVHGDVITQLTDTSGSANHATQATSSKRATVDTTNLMGTKHTAKFTAANNQWYKSALVQPSKVTQYVAFRGYVSGSFLGNFGITTNAQSQENTLAHVGRNPADRKLTYPTGVTLDTAGNHLLVMRYDYDDGTYEMWLDGRLIGARDPSNTVSVPAAAYMIGAWRDTSTNQPLEGNIGGVWIATRLHTDRERRGIQDMLASRYSVTLLDRV